MDNPEFLYVDKFSSKDQEYILNYLLNFIKETNNNNSQILEDKKKLLEHFKIDNILELGDIGIVFESLDNVIEKILDLSMFINKKNLSLILSGLMEVYNLSIGIFSDISAISHEFVSPRYYNQINIKYGENMSDFFIIQDLATKYQFIILDIKETFLSIINRLNILNDPINNVGIISWVDGEMYIGNGKKIQFKKDTFIYYLFDLIYTNFKNNEYFDYEKIYDLLCRDYYNYKIVKNAIDGLKKDELMKKVREIIDDINKRSKRTLSKEIILKESKNGFSANIGLKYKWNL